MSRRTVLAGAALAGCGPTGMLAFASCTADPAAQPSGPASTTVGPVPQRFSYGEDPAQFGELTVPAGQAPSGVVVIIHGGFWQAVFDLDLGRPLAADLVSRGYAVWNLEYRRIGQGGGWPATLADVAVGFDHLRELPGELDVDRAVVIGHSAGGQLAAWLAGRSDLPSDAVGAQPRVQPVAVVAQAGVMDLVGAARDGVGGRAVADLLGGEPDAVPDRYAIASPLDQVPVKVPVRCVHARADGNVPYAQSEQYVRSAKAAGADAELVTVPGNHFTLIDPATPDWQAVVKLLPGLLGR